MDQENLPQGVPPQEPEPVPQPPSTSPEPIPAPPAYSAPPSMPAILPTSTMAVVSLIAGIVGFTVAPVLGSIVALIAGYAARKDTRAVPPTASGDGMATAGIVMGWIVIALAVVGCCCGLLAFLVSMGIGGASFWRH